MEFKDYSTQHSERDVATQQLGSSSRVRAFFLASGASKIDVPAPSYQHSLAHHRILAVSCTWKFFFRVSFSANTTAGAADLQQRYKHKKKNMQNESSRCNKYCEVKQK